MVVIGVGVNKLSQIVTNQEYQFFSPFEGSNIEFLNQEHDSIMGKVIMLVPVLFVLFVGVYVAKGAAVNGFATVSVMRYALFVYTLFYFC